MFIHAFCHFLSHSQLEIVCPTGFERRGSVCNKIDVICPGNLTYNGTICIPSIRCPSEYVQKGKYN